ncbi:MAG TPA: hypothetical protein VK304_04470 [Thermoleophilaceae bacterium]|nr:hypothetical protein [Thermoleophilaceae bacterium]
MLTVRALVAEMDLELAAGEAGAEAPARWVHTGGARAGLRGADGLVRVEAGALR